VGLAAERQVRMVYPNYYLFVQNKNLYKIYY